MHGNTGVVQLIGKSHVATIGAYGIVQPHIIIQHSPRHNQFQSGLLKIIGFIPFEGIFFAMLHRTDSGIPALYGETDCVYQNERDVEKCIYHQKLMSLCDNLCFAW